MIDRKTRSTSRRFVPRTVLVAAALLVAVTLTGPSRAFAQAPGAATPGGQGRGSGPNRVGGWEWWNDADVQRALALSPEKVRTIHEIFTRRSESLKPMADEFMRASMELDKMTRARVVDEATYQLQVVRLEALRAELNKGRTLMLYRLTRELTPDQFKKLEDLRAQRFADRGRGGQ